MKTPDRAVVYATQQQVESMCDPVDAEHNEYMEVWFYPKGDASVPLIPAASLDALRGERDADRLRYLQMSHERDAILDQLQAAEAKLAAVGAERDVLRAFANDVMEEWWEGDLDGGSRQDIAERHGLIAPQEVTEPCSDTCVCAEVDAFPLMCFRRTELLTGTLIADAGTGEGG